MAVQDYIQETDEYRAITAAESGTDGQSSSSNTASNRTGTGEAFALTMPNDVDALEALQVVLLVLIYLELRGGG